MMKTAMRREEEICVRGVDKCIQTKQDVMHVLWGLCCEAARQLDVKPEQVAFRVACRSMMCNFAIHETAKIRDEDRKSVDTFERTFKVLRSMSTKNGDVEKAIKYLVRVASLLCSSETAITPESVRKQFPLVALTGGADDDEEGAKGGECHHMTSITHPSFEDSLSLEALRAIVHGRGTVEEWVHFVLSETERAETFRGVMTHRRWWGLFSSNAFVLPIIQRTTLFALFYQYFSPSIDCLAVPMETSFSRDMQNRGVLPVFITWSAPAP